METPNPALKEEITLKQLTSILIQQQRKIDLKERGEKMKRIILLLARGAVLVTVFTMPGIARIFKDIDWERSDEEDWKLFNTAYLKRTIKRLERQKIIEIKEKENLGIVKITERGKKFMLKYAVESLTIPKPPRWDHKWRIVFYDVLYGKRGTRDKFRRLLSSAGFYPLQESVYLHAYPCGKEIEFLRQYLGIGSEVRLVIAEKIENDSEFRKFFGV